MHESHPPRPQSRQHQHRFARTNTLELASRVTEAPDRYEFRTADGVCSKNAFRTAELLLLEALWAADLGRLLCPQANYGVVGTVLAPRASTVQFTETDARAARLCEQNCAANGVDAPVALTADLTSLGEFDTVAYAPKPYTPVELGRQRLADALSALAPGGHLYLATADDTGGPRYESVLRDLGASVSEIASKDCVRVLQATRPQQCERQSFVTPRTVTETVGGVDLSLVTLPGVFSASGLDDGTRRLLESTTVRDGDRVLDLCCGAGAVGAFAGLVADCDLWASDVDRVATQCAERTLAANDVAGRAVTADCLAGVRGQQFDRVLCNPPTHAGDGVLATLLDGAHDVLRQDGRLDLVHHAALDLSAHLDRFSDLEPLHDGETYTVLRATP